jgi:HEPN domain-containing protein
MRNTFKKSDGYNTKDLLQYGLDHLACSLQLFDFQPRAYDSAGYLAHLGIELYLKAIMLHDLGYFISTHDFDEIRIKKNMPDSFFELPRTYVAIYNKLNKFSDLRYPKLSETFEIGSDDKEKIRSLSDEILQKLPKKLKDEIDEVDHTTKGGRILMKKSVDDKSSGT